MATYETRQTGRNFTAVLLAVAILGVIGAVFGYVVGVRANEREQAGGGGPATDGPTAGQTATTQPPSGERCPRFIEDAAQQRGAKVPTSLRLYIRTDWEEVWICTEAGGGRTWYQGHEKTNRYYPDEVPVEGKNGILLQVVNTTHDSYVATNGDTTYTVSKKEIKVNGPRSYTHPVTDHRPKD